MKNWLPFSVTSGILVSLLFFQTGCSHDHSYTLQVSAGEYSRDTTPIITQLPEEWKDFPYFSLENLDSGNFIPVQRIDKGEVVFVLDEPIAAGSTRQYRIRPLIVDPHENHVMVESDPKGIEVKANGKQVLYYHSAVAKPPAGSPDYYQRSGFLHPVYTPGGQVITDDFPPDHMHQHGVFFAWTKSTYEGGTYDLWNQHKGLGGVRHVEVIDTLSGAVYGQFTTRLLHSVYKEKDTTTVLNESWRVRVYRTNDHFLWDLQSTHTCAGVVPFTLEKYSYGGLGIRGNGQWFVEGDTLPEYPKFATNQGLDRLSGNHQPAKWVDMSGPVDGITGGLTVMGSPKNFRFPQPARLHPEMPYFSISPVVNGGFTIEPGSPYTSRYRFVVHDGMADPTRIEQIWQDYAEPPQVAWAKD